MKTTKESDVFGLSNASTAYGLSIFDQAFPATPARSLSKDEQRVCDEWNKQMLVIDSQTDKTTFGTTKIGEIHRHGTLTFHESVAYVLDLKSEAANKEHQNYMDEFTKRQLQMLGRHVLGAIEVGSSHIGAEIHRPLYPEPEPETPEPRSLWQRLFG